MQLVFLIFIFLSLCPAFSILGRIERDATSVAWHLPANPTLLSVSSVGSSGMQLAHVYAER